MSAYEKTLIVIMGVSGCGKSTVGRALARSLHCAFLEADDLHPVANIEKMSSGNPLTDVDRVDWVKAICASANKRSDRVAILACSALTLFVQSQLDSIERQVVFIHLNTENVDMTGRLKTRDHFMPPELLMSQYVALAVPDDAFEFDAGLSVDTLTRKISATLHEKFNVDHSAHAYLES